MYTCALRVLLSSNKSATSKQEIKCVYLIKYVYIKVVKLSCSHTVKLLCYFRLLHYTFSTGAG